MSKRYHNTQYLRVAAEKGRRVMVKSMKVKTVRAPVASNKKVMAAR